ncbi:nucleotidyltransferase domain-containing protein [Candidatus Woesearchaeota archaeon]|nr:nucleotidyltransferase domain-containing protein [Candidatus Woesearchaeota archaeon]
MDNNHKIINFLGKNIGKEYTMHNLSNLLKVPYATFHRVIKKMGSIIQIKEIGKSKVIRLNISNPIIKSRLTVASDEERKEFLENEIIIKKIANELNTQDIVILFGSYAKGTKTQKSDIDLLIINKDGRKSLSFSKYEVIYKKQINPLFITKREFKEMLKSDEENVGKQALNNHIILNGPEEFWGLVLDAF